MARTQTLAQLRTAVRQRADMVNSQFVTDAEVNEYINQSIAEWWDLLIASRGQDWFLKTSTFTTVNGTALYSLPTDFYELLLVEANLGGYNVPLLPFSWVEHGRLSQMPVQGGTVITIYYVPEPPRLVADGDTMEGYAGWEEYVIVDAAMKCLAKEESDISYLVKQKNDMRQRIMTMAPNRDAGMPGRVQDVARTPFSPFALLPKPKYRIRGQADFSGTSAAQIELVQGAMPGGVW